MCNGFNWPTCLRSTRCESVLSKGNCTWEAPWCDGTNWPNCRSKASCQPQQFILERNCTYYGNMSLKIFNLILTAAAVPGVVNQVDLTSLDGKVYAPCSAVKPGEACSDQRLCTEGNFKNCTWPSSKLPLCQLHGPSSGQCTNMAPCSIDSSANCSVITNMIMYEYGHSAGQAVNIFVLYRYEVRLNFTRYLPLSNIIDWMRHFHDHVTPTTLIKGQVNQLEDVIYNERDQLMIPTRKNVVEASKTVQAKWHDKTTAAYGIGHRFDAFRGKTISGVRYCRKPDESDITGMELTFGFGITQEFEKFGTLTA